LLTACGVPRFFFFCSNEESGFVDAEEIFFRKVIESDCSWTGN